MLFQRLRQVFWWSSQAVVCIFILTAAWGALRAQQQQTQQGQPQQKPLSSLERSRTEDILSQIHAELKKSYYDPKFHGVDIDERYKAYRERLKGARSLGDAYRVVAAFLSGLEDSHTYFEPPARSYEFDYGFQMQMFGNQCFITEVRPNSDAANKLHPGDQVLRVGTYGVDRKSLWQLEYYLYQLAPQPAIEFTLRDPSGNIRGEQIVTKYKQHPRVNDLSLGNPEIWRQILKQESQLHYIRNRYVERGEVFIWKLPIFVSDDEGLGADLGGGLGHTLNLARKHKILILDLRGNPGGEVIALEYVIRNLFDHEVKVATKVTRKGEKDEVVKSGGTDAFNGRLIVLMDSRSASAAEILARVVQLEHRGTVIGDISSGSVMESRSYPMEEGADILVFFGASITEANLIMSDGGSLEKVGVTPDILVLPTAADLAAHRDPALSHAAELAGLKLDPTVAGKLFPFEWAPF